MLVIHRINKTSPAAMWLRFLHMYAETLIKIRCIYRPQSVSLISIGVKEHLSEPAWLLAATAAAVLTCWWRSRDISTRAKHSHVEAELLRMRL